MAGRHVYVRQREAHAASYEVVAAGDVFPYPTLRQMAGFARSLDRRGYDVRCQVRCGANIAAFKRDAWADLRPISADTSP
jgi:hypothetical protein